MYLHEDRELFRDITEAAADETGIYMTFIS